MKTVDNFKKVYQQIANLTINKVSKIAGKGLSSNDFTNEHKSLLENSVAYEPKYLELAMSTSTTLGDYATNEKLLAFNTISKSTFTASIYDITNGLFTAPKTGVYQFSLSLCPSVPIDVVYVYINNVNKYTWIGYAGMSYGLLINNPIYLTQGDVVKMSVYNTSSVTISGNTALNNLKIISL